MHLVDFIKMLGDEISSILYEVHWIDKNGTDLGFSTTYREALIDVFGQCWLHESDTIFMSAKDDRITLQLYIDKP